MTSKTLVRQVGRPGPVLCHYRLDQHEVGYKLSRGGNGVLLSFSCCGHAFAVGWMVR